MLTKHSKKRDAILDAIAATKEHPSAYMVYDSVKTLIPDLSLATVYRNLALFKKEGLVQTVATVDGEERYDGNVSPHLHFVCECCGSVLDIEGVADLSSCERQIMKTCGGRVTSYSVVFRGFCKKCENRL